MVDPIHLPISKITATVSIERAIVRRKIEKRRLRPDRETSACLRDSVKKRKKKGQASTILRRDKMKWFSLPIVFENLLCLVSSFYRVQPAFRIFTSETRVDTKRERERETRSRRIIPRGNEMPGKRWELRDRCYWPMCQFSRQFFFVARIARLIRT